MVDMELEVHAGGDIFIRYGKGSQWVHSPLTKKASAISIIGTAFAESSVFNSSGTYSQQEFTKNGTIVRNRYFEDGKLESYTINPTTGAWSAPQIGKFDKLPAEIKSGVPVTTFPQIDLTK